MYLGILKHFGAFSLGDLQAAKAAIGLLQKYNISHEDFVRSVDRVQLDKKSKRAFLKKRVPSIPLREMKPVFCPVCGDTIITRTLTNNSKGFKINLACVSESCDFDHYDKRSHREILNEGIRSNVSESIDEGTSAEPVVGKE